MFYGRDVVFISVFVAIITAVLISLFDNSFESARCERLENELQVNLTYSYNKGCQVVWQKT